ncbi:MAG: sigma-70 family RNA polymerase sigma factor [Planctomycetes bacterium]|nr:sigma-70 family RNA polymerase sigma factor [Planctomycetota bacterium]
MDSKSLASLVTLYQAGIYRYIRFLGASEAVAEDVVQETFLATLKSQSHPDAANGKLMAGWLRGVARNLFLAYCRRNRISPVNVNTEYVEQAEDFWTSEFLREDDGDEYIAALRASLADLSNEERKMLDAQYNRKLSRTQIAREFGFTEDGVKSKMRRIRLRLGELIHRRLSAGEHK